MADPKEDEKVLKEIEDSLFQEFNEQVRLTEPTDSRLQNNIDLNPNIIKKETPEPVVVEAEKQTKPPSNEQAASEVPPKPEEVIANPTVEEKKADAIALGDAFASTVEKDKAVESEEEDLTELIGPQPPVVEKKSAVATIKLLLAKVKALKIPAKLGKSVKWIFSVVFFPISWFWHLTRIQKVYICLIVVGLVSFGLLSLRFYQDTFHPKKTSLYVLSFSEVEDRHHTFPVDEKREVFFSPAYTPDYVFIIPKVIANIKRSENSSDTPMVFVEFIFKASNQQTAIEFKDRKIEIQDIAARTLEEYDYDTLREQSGLIALRKDVARNVNPILNNGIVIDVLYKTFIIKP